jgi:hypothetical protein
MGATCDVSVNRVTTVAAKALMTRRWRKWKGLNA